MNQRPNIPDEIGCGKGFSWLAAGNAGGVWMMVVFLTDLPGDYLIRQNEGWPLVWRAMIALIPWVAGLLYVRSAARWIGGMDELHRRLSLEAFLLAAVAYLFLGAAWFHLNAAGVWTAMARATELHLERMPFSNCTTILCLTYVLFGVCYGRLVRHYR